MRFFSHDKPKIKVQTTKADGFSGWLKCTHCCDMIHVSELAQNFNCCPRCDYHYRLAARERVASIADEGSWQELFSDLRSVDTLEFNDTQSYKDRLAKASIATENTEGIVTGFCTIERMPSALAVMDFNFMAGSMGSVVGEKLTALTEKATENFMPLVIVSASGGARMQESIFSLMQMAKTSAALAYHHEAGLPYISVLTNPTSGGVTASFASLGDIIIAEPNALICFAGPRVVAQVVGEDLPPGAQKSEFLLERGMIDCIVKRPLLKESLVKFISFLTENDRSRFKNSKEEPEVLNDKIKAFFLLTDDNE
ncbi:Acetyl-coenzyme A carboxylase carboxyl transferase subunit beta [Candidatus Clavichlamydia salmonicola]|uniref:acetyl-CoA carboxylase, carboxyltransferase subunit beta n=1 Tax=Candidatus Clavichlamydia salmonicola TaxID=469812 RepID=UPI0018919BAD|nr:acetyl-CoA carboxylase, carboxyltransferase subunit beta [Candidatus Clavichlamydia salmonicola]MBF5050924.1 Acetyl-coenzyme A carboxylase carboxyl transferase subunit beta [Candidatus Clavichlamydia salmonicola]